MKQIAVIGSNLNVDDATLRIAEEVGAGIAKHGAVLVCGGREGIMEAACKGAKDAGGLTVGILPGDYDEANPYLDIVIPTKIGFARNAIVANSADVVIAIKGSLGTLSEVCFALVYGKKVIAIEESGGISTLVPEMGELPEIKHRIEMFKSDLHVVKTAKEAVELAFE